jgi:hypothetical protein
MDTPTPVGSYTCDMPVYFLAKLTKYSYGLAVTNTILFYYFCSAIYTAFKTNQSSKTAFGLLTGAYIITVVIQVLFLRTQLAYGKCTMTLAGMLISIAVGCAVGLLFFGLIAGLTPERLPYVPDIVESFSLNGGFGKTPPPSVVKTDASDAPSNVEKSSKPDDKDEFVCDLYKNGQLITSTISE